MKSWRHSRNGYAPSPLWVSALPGTLLTTHQYMLLTFGLTKADQSGKRFIPVHPDSLPRVGPLWIATVIFSMSLWAFEVDELIGCQDRVITVIDHLTPRWTKWVAAQQRACSLESSALFHKHLAFYDWVLSELWSQSGLGLVWCCLDSADKS